MRRAFLPALLLLALAVPAAAQASGITVLNDCNDDEQLSKVYTQKEYQAALNMLNGDDDQYTGCQDIIQRAMIAAAARNKGSGGSRGSGTAASGSGGAAGAGGGSGGVGSTAVPTPVGTNPFDAASPADQTAARQAQAQGATPVEIAGATITPGDPGTLVSSLGDLPTPVLVLLGILAAAALAAAGLFVKSRVVGRSA